VLVTEVCSQQAQTSLQRMPDSDATQQAELARHLSRLCLKHVSEVEELALELARGLEEAERQGDSMRSALAAVSVFEAQHFAEACPRASRLT
jgi:hypothetical protein